MVLAAKGTKVWACFSSPCRYMQTSGVEVVVFHQEFVLERCHPLAHIYPQRWRVCDFRYMQYKGICPSQLGLLYWFLKLRELNFVRNLALGISLVRFPELARWHLTAQSEVSVCPQKYSSRKSSNLPGFQIYLSVWTLISPLQYLRFSPFLS